MKYSWSFFLNNQYFEKYYKDDKDLKAFEQKLEGTYTGILYEEVEKKAEEHGYKIKMNQFLELFCQTKSNEVSLVSYYTIFVRKLDCMQNKNVNNNVTGLYKWENPW